MTKTCAFIFAFTLTYNSNDIYASLFSKVTYFGVDGKHSIKPVELN